MTIHFNYSPAFALWIKEVFVIDFDVCGGVKGCESTNFGGKRTTVKEVVLENRRKRKFSQWVLSALPDQEGLVVGFSYLPMSYLFVCL